jgi:TRAP-type C4-dicarboxylate transport system permease small subunit
LTPALHRLSAALAGAGRILAAATLVIGVLINFANVVLRYGFSAPLTWADEAMQFLMVAGVFFGAIAVTWDGRHIRMDILAERAPPAARRALDIVVDLATFGLSLLLAWYGVVVALRFLRFGQTSEAAGIPMALPQGVLPVAFAIMALLAAARLAGGRARAGGRQG